MKSYEEYEETDSMSAKISAIIIAVVFYAFVLGAIIKVVKFLWYF